MTQKTILVTGASGFIGYNLCKRLEAFQYFRIVALDKIPLKNSLDRVEFLIVDMKNIEELRRAITQYKPEVIIHLAARTDLNGRSLADYSDNLLPVQNLCKLVSEYKFVKTVFFTSSMLVHSPGKLGDKFSFDTVYGQSKAEGEKIVQQFSFSSTRYCILRPSSIWGPFFEAPYKQFFLVVLSGRYFLFGKLAAQKTFGYVGNAVNQIISLVENESWSSGEIFYLGDSPSLSIDDFAKAILACNGRVIRIQLPAYVIRLLARIGDYVSKFGFRFPMTSFRLRNITTENIVPVSNTENLNQFEKINLEHSVKETISFLKSEVN